MRVIDYRLLYIKSQESTESSLMTMSVKHTSSESYTLVSEIAQLKHC